MPDSFPMNRCEPNRRGTKSVIVVESFCTAALSSPRFHKKTPPTHGYIVQSELTEEQSKAKEEKSR